MTLMFSMNLGFAWGTAGGASPPGAATLYVNANPVNEDGVWLVIINP